MNPVDPAQASKPVANQAPVYVPRGGHMDAGRAAGDLVRMDQPSTPEAPAPRSIEQISGSLLNIFA